MHLAQPAEVVEVPAQRVQRRQVVGVPHGGLGHVRLRHPGGEHVARERLILGVGHRSEGDALPRPPRHRSVRAAEEARRTQLLRAAVDPRAAEAREVLLELAPHHRRVAASRQVRAAHERDVIREREAAAASAASQPGPSGTESCVRNATWVPGASSIRRLRVPPCENSARGISSTRAPCRRASSTEPSVEPESMTSSSTSPATPSCARTAASTSPSSAPAVEHGQRDGDVHRRHGPAILGAADGC